MKYVQEVKATISRKFCDAGERSELGSFSLWKNCTRSVKTTPFTSVTNSPKPKH